MSAIAFPTMTIRSDVRLLLRVGDGSIRSARSVFPFSEWEGRMAAVQTDQIVTIDAVREAQGRLGPYVRRTPLLQSLQWPEIFFKAESLQPTGSFKVRAAFNQLLLLSESERRRGVVTSSSGNFAQATAYAGHLLGISTKIVMMESANPIKVASTRRWGGEILFCEDRFEAREQGGCTHPGAGKAHLDPPLRSPSWNGR